jgi:alkylhydroperoxidase family enzyme
VHAAFFASRVGFDDGTLAALAHGPADDMRWTPDEQALLQVADSLLADCDIDDVLWADLRSHLSEEAILELILLTGFYRTVSCIVRALRLPQEPFAPAFPA